MNGFYTISQSLFTQLKKYGFNVVTMGDNFKIDIVRQTIFPYAHIIPDTSVKSGQTTSWGFRIIAMDLVDFNKDDPRDEIEPFYSTDNMQDVLNDIHNRLSRVIEQYERGTEYDNFLRIDDDVNFLAFMERYENLLAGWEMDIIIEAPTNGNICK